MINKANKRSGPNLVCPANRKFTLDFVNLPILVSSAQKKLIKALFLLIPNLLLLLILITHILNFFCKIYLHCPSKGKSLKPTKEF